MIAAYIEIITQFILIAKNNMHNITNTICHVSERKGCTLTPTHCPMGTWVVLLKKIVNHQSKSHLAPQHPNLNITY